MQDIHAIGGGAAGSGGGRSFGGGDRRLRPHNHPNHQALKCPRCDSLNTKFCYYNNYNLSQPRHFCKSCRRYWTKGGVLRNVPVGGGCRKTKRSKQKTSAAAASGDGPRQLSTSAQTSSSESSSLTAATTAATPTSATTAVAEEGSAPSTTPSNSAVLYNFPDARLFNANPNFDHHHPIVNQSTAADGQIFTTEIASLTSLMASSADMNMGFGLADIPTTSYRRAEQENPAPASDNPGPGMRVDEFKVQEMSGGMENDGLAAALDWGSGGGGDGGGAEHGLYDLTAAVDPAYWSQPQWTDNDQSLKYLP